MHTYKITLEYADREPFVYEGKAYNDLRALYVARQEAKAYGWVGKVVRSFVMEIK